MVPPSPTNCFLSHGAYCPCEGLEHPEVPMGCQEQMAGTGDTRYSGSLGITLLLRNIDSFMFNSTVNCLLM